MQHLSPQEFDAFVAFGREHLASAQPVASLEELFTKWRDRQPIRPLSEDDIEAVHHAVEDMRNGDTGRPVESHLSELHARHSERGG